MKATRSADKICDEKVEEESNKSASNNTNICRRSLLPAACPGSAKRCSSAQSPRLIPGTYKFYRISGKGAVNLREGSFSRFRVSRGKNHRSRDTPRRSTTNTARCCGTDYTDTRQTTSTWCQNKGQLMPNNPTRRHIFNYYLIPTEKVSVHMLLLNQHNRTYYAWTNILSRSRVVRLPTVGTRFPSENDIG